MRRRQTVGDLGADANKGRKVERPSGANAGVEGATGHKLHYQIGRARLLADGVDNHHIGMVDGRGGAGFSQEPAFRFGTGDQLRRQHLDGHHAMQSGVKRFEDDAHAAASQRAEDVAVADAAENLRVIGGEQKADVESGDFHRVVFLAVGVGRAVGEGVSGGGSWGRNAGLILQAVEFASACVAFQKVSPYRGRGWPIEQPGHKAL